MEGCPGTEANFKLILNACDPLKLLHLEFACTSADILAFIADRMVHLEDISFIIDGRTPLFLENVSKLQNLQKLKSAKINCMENVPAAPIIDALANIQSLKSLYFNDMSELLPDEITAGAINNLLYVDRFEYTSAYNTLPFDKITNFRLTNYSHTNFLFDMHSYTFNAMN